MSRLEELKLQIRQSIEAAGQKAIAAVDPLEFAAAFRRLLALVKEQYPFYIYAHHGIDPYLGETPEDYPGEKISAECEALLDFCESERFIRLVRRFDPALAKGETPFFSFLNSTVWKDAQKLLARDALQEKYAGMTGLTEYRQKEREEKIFYHAARVLRAKGRVNPSDYDKIAAAVGCERELVIDVLHREWAVGTAVRLDLFVDEEEDLRMHDLIADPRTLPDEAGDERLLTRAYLQLEPTLSEMERQAARLGFTKALIDERLRFLIRHLRAENKAINSVPTLFEQEGDYVLQQFMVLKAEFEGNPMIEPRLLDLAAKERQSPTFARLGSLVGRSEESFRKSYNNVRKKLSGVLAVQ